jgi:hypothetical protein
MSGLLVRIGSLVAVLVALDGCGRRNLAGDASSSTDVRIPADAGSSVDLPASTPRDGAVFTDASGTFADAGSPPLSGFCPPGRAPLRRLSAFEYNNTVRDLMGDTSRPGDAFPSYASGTGFPNDSDTLSALLPVVEQYRQAAKTVAARAMQVPDALAKFAPCITTVTAPTADSCARTFVGNFTQAAYRRALAPGDADELLALHSMIRATGGDFATASAAIIEAVLQSPDFLYRVESGVDDVGRPGVRRLTGDEMATRLSYFFWGTSPDEALRAAALAGELQSAEGVKAQALRLLEDPRSHDVVRFFFDYLLPISQLGELERDPSLFPSFSKTIGSLMREETQRFLENEIFVANGSWPSVLIAPYTFVNEPLARFYGMTGVTGDAFLKIPVDPQRLGLLTQGGLMTGSVPSNLTNPALRGAFVMRKLMCRDIETLTDPVILAQVNPASATGVTARERFTNLTSPPICLSCHQYLNPPGFALENFDAVGLYRATENGETIDANVTIPGLPGTVNGGVDLARKLADSTETQACFAKHWMEFAYGRGLAADGADACLREAVSNAFQQAGYNVQRLLLDLTQTDAFLFLPKE